MKVEDYIAYDALGLADLVRKGDVTPDELLDCALRRVEETNPTLNAVIGLFEDEARAAIKRGLPEGPFGGVPFLVKDLRIAMAGRVTGSGGRVFADGAPSKADSAIVAAYRAAGLVIFGKTNTPELGLNPVTEPEAFGPTLNPWNLELTAGGSSGGAASAVAAGMAPAGHASDGGGSIRIPASCCGVFGLKPSRGRVSTAPFAEGWGGMSTQHAITWSVRDSAAMLDVECQPQPGDPYWHPAPAISFLEETKRAPGRLRVAFSTQSLRTGGEVAPACAAAVKEAAALCADLGHDVEEAKLDLDIGAYSQAFMILVCANIALSIDQAGSARGRAVQEGEVEPLTWDTALMGRDITGAQYADAVYTVQTITRQAAAFFGRFDVLILSTLGREPVPLGYLAPSAENLPNYGPRISEFMPNTQLFNGTGQPAMSAPLHVAPSGMPVGVQFIARAGEEGLLFRLGAQLETARPWANRRPPHLAR